MKKYVEIKKFKTFELLDFSAFSSIIEKTSAYLFEHV